MQGLTREEAINEHRKMWNWIADKLLMLNLENSSVEYDIDQLEEEYLMKYTPNYHDKLRYNDFLCEYTKKV